MLTYRIKVFENPDDKKNPWAWAVYSWWPQRYLIGSGQNSTKADATDAALTLLDKSEREGWLASTSLHLSHR